MKAILVIDIPNEYSERYNVNEMYVWSLVVQDKQGYEMFDLTTDKPSHLKSLPQKKGISLKEAIGVKCSCYSDGFNDCLDEITGETE